MVEVYTTDICFLYHIRFHFMNIVVRIQEILALLYHLGFHLMYLFVSKGIEFSTLPNPSITVVATLILELDELEYNFLFFMLYRIRPLVIR